MATSNKIKNSERSPQAGKYEAAMATAPAIGVLSAAIAAGVLLPNAYNALIRWGDSSDIDAFTNEFISLLSQLENGELNIDEFMSQMESLESSFEAEFSALEAFSREQIALDNFAYGQVTTAVDINRNQFKQTIEDWVRRQEDGTLIEVPMNLVDETVIFNREEFLEELNEQAQDFLWQEWLNTAGNNTISIFALLVFAITLDVIRRRILVKNTSKGKRKNSGTIESDNQLNESETYDRLRIEDGQESDDEAGNDPYGETAQERLER